MPPRTKAPKIREDESKITEFDAAASPEAEKSEGDARREHETSLRRLAEVMPFTPS
jgi:hypothetical protein